MKRLHILMLLSALSLSAAVNIALAWWPKGWYMPATARELSTPEVQAVEMETETGQPDSKGISEEWNNKSDWVNTAEASIFPGAPTENISREEIEILLDLRAIKETLDARAKMLDERQQAIEKAESGVAKHVDELEALLAKIQDRLQQEESIRSKKIKRLTAVYASMKPEKSAPVISKMELATVVKMFARMDEKKVGKILSFLPPEQAVKITQALTKQIGALDK